MSSPSDPELATAVAGREHWAADGAAAVYAPPGATVTVRVQRMAIPAKYDRYVTSVIRGGTAAYTMLSHTAEQAVTVAERVRDDYHGARPSAG